MAQTRECTATGQFVRFVEGYGMLVANGVEPIDVPVHVIPNLVLEGLINDPMDPDGNGKKGGSKRGRAATPETDAGTSPADEDEAPVE